MRRAVVASLAGLVAAFGILAVVPAHAAQWTSASYASRLVTLLDQARQQHGLRSLSVASGTSQVAAGWTAHLDATKSLAHNPDLRHQLETHGSPDWTSYGENVGEGPSSDPDALFQAYMNSSEHRANILNPAYRYLGVSVVLDGKTAWNTFDFVDTYHAPEPAAVAPSRPAPKKPAPSPSLRPRHPATGTAAATPAPSAPAAEPPHRPAAAHRAGSRSSHASAGLPRGRVPLRSPVAGGSTAGAAVRTAALGPLPVPAAPAGQVPIALAGALVGFLGVRWAQVRLMRPLPVVPTGAPRDLPSDGSLVCPGPERPVLEVSWTATSPHSSPPASAPPSTALRRLRSPISSRPSSPPSGRAAGRR